jgi:hypothetical protein
MLWSPGGIKMFHNFVGLLNLKHCWLVFEIAERNINIEASSFIDSVRASIFRGMRGQELDPTK